MAKQIRIQHVIKGAASLKDKTFSSYAKVARVLEVGDSVVVAVYDPSFCIGDTPILEGYGEVHRESEDGYSCPRHLQHDW